MMSRTLHMICLLAVLSLLSCDKQKSTSKKLIGTWEIKQYRITLLDGITEYADCQGTLTMESSDFEDWNNTFKFSMTYAFPSFSGTNQNAGYFRITQKGDYMDASYRDANNVETDLLEYRIMVLNRTDLQVVFRDANGMDNYMTFRKQK